MAALRQQIAGLRAENLALRTALGGDKEAAAVIAAAGRGAQVSDLSEAQLGAMICTGSLCRGRCAWLESGPVQLGSVRSHINMQ